MRRHSLRVRVASAFAALGAVLSLLFAIGIWLAARDVSQRLIDQTLKAELDDYVARRGRNPASLPPATTTLRGFVAAAGSDAAGAPAALRGLPPGQHEIGIDGTPFRVAVADHRGERYYILFNEERQRARERRFVAYLVGGAVLLTLFAAVGGYWLAGRVIAPVTELARAVAGAPTENPPRLSTPDQPRDELDDLTRAFDRYLSRLAAFIERERAFAADASHELRTPLAVIRGAAEVLADDPRLDSAQTRRVARIERAAGEMSALIDGLLLLAREDEATVDAACDGAALLRNSVERYRPLAEQRRNRLQLAIAAEPRLEVAPALFTIVVDNLLRNAVAHTEDGTINVYLHADRLVVADSGVGIRDADLGRVFQRYYRGAASAGSGIGLSLVKRICDRQGWEVTLESREGGGTSATLRFLG